MPIEGRLVALHVLIDRILGWLKWPSAILMLGLLPATLRALGELALRMGSWPPPIILFAAGVAAQQVVWRRLFRRVRLRWVVRLERELTRTLFAWATLHRLTEPLAETARPERRAADWEGNWLITVGPYFFPTGSFLLIVLLTAIPLPTLGLGALLLGGAFAHHLTALLTEARGGGSDFRKAGRLFCWLFLPPANLLAGGVVVSYAHGGAAGLVRFVAAVCRGVHGRLI